MRDLVILFVHVIATLIRLLGPGGIRSVVAETVLVKQQLLILNRSRQRSPNLRTSDRLVAGLCALLIRPDRLIRSAIVMKPSTLLSLHQAMKNRKYRLLFSPKRRGKSGPKGPGKDLIEAVVRMKQRRPAWGCPRIARQIAMAFGIEINKDMVRRILAAHYRPDPHRTGPSWLSFPGHAHDSAAQTLEHESALINDKVDKRNPHRARMTSPVLIHRAFVWSWDFNPSLYFRIMVLQNLGRGTSKMLKNANSPQTGDLRPKSAPGSCEKIDRAASPAAC